MGYMKDRRIRVDEELLKRIETLTKGSNAKTHAERLRIVVNMAEKQQSPEAGQATIDLSESSINKISIGVYNDLKTYLSGEFEKLKG